MKKILFFRLGGLGDLLVTLPSILLLRREFASCSFTLVCRKEYGEILKETGIVNSILSFEDREIINFISGNEAEEQKISRINEEFHLILGWFQSSSTLKTLEGVFPKRGGRSNFFIFDPGLKMEMSRYFFQETKRSLVPESTLCFEECLFLPLNSGQKEEGLRLLEGYASSSSKGLGVVHPGSGSKRKCWPLSHFLFVIDYLSSRGFKGALVTGYAEERMEERLRNSKLPQGWVWLKNPPLLKLAGLLSASDIYLGNDSGITHLAAACGTKVIALFLEGFVDVWRPYGLTAILSAKRLEEISPQTVIEVIELYLKKGFSSFSGHQ